MSTAIGAGTDLWRSPEADVCRRAGKDAGKMKEREISIVHLQMVKDGRIPFGEIKLDSPANAARAVGDFLGNRDREYVVVCCVDSGMKPTYIQITGIGSIRTCLVSVPETFKTAILSNASGLLLFHTHPSGEVEPSKEDMAVTRKITEAGKMLDIPLQDHIILGADGEYFSFRESGILDAAV